jgi:hypothetical protein
MRTVPAVLVLCLSAACSQKEEAKAPPAPPPGPTLATFAGTWESKAMLEGTKDPVESTMSGTADASTWTMTLKGRPPVPLTVSISGDSLIGQTAEYESVLRKGVMVTVRTASVLKDGMLTGNLVATYKTPKGTEVVKGTITSTRAPAK